MERIMKKFGGLCLILMITFTIFAGCSGCSGCTSKAERERIAAEEQARLEEEARLAEEARLSAEEAQFAADEAQFAADEAQLAADEARLAANSAPQSKDAQLAADEAQRAADEAKLAAERARQAQEAKLAEEARFAADEAKLAAQRARDAAQRAQDAAATAAAEARRKAGASQAPRPTTYPSETNASIPLVGTWANNNKNIILQLKANGTITVHEYSITDQTVDVKFEANRGVTGGGYYKRINPADVQSSYKGTGTYTIKKDVIDIKLSLKNEFGTTKDVSLSSKFSLDANKTNLRLEHGFARKFIYNRENRKEIDTNEFVSGFLRQ
jgi:multidrug efflux pump subunit AcrA (membrane-fusion protein)